MPLPGGPAEKFGNRYEGRWIVACLLDVLDERADSIRLEPPGPEEQGFEFWITKQGIREYHQAKRQHPSGHWTLYTLAEEGVLTNFITRLQDPLVRCVFVSGNAAGQLEELSDRARRSASWGGIQRNIPHCRPMEEELQPCSRFPSRFTRARDL